MIQTPRPWAPPSNDNARPHQGVRFQVLLWDGSIRRVVISSAVTDTFTPINHKDILASYLKVPETEVVGIHAICHLNEKTAELNNALGARCGYVFRELEEKLKVWEFEEAKAEFRSSHLRSL